MLFNEPKLLKLRAPSVTPMANAVSVLFNEPKLLKCLMRLRTNLRHRVSVLFNEPKLLKSKKDHQHSGEG